MNPRAAESGAVVRAEPGFRFAHPGSPLPRHAMARAGSPRSNAIAWTASRC